MTPDSHQPMHDDELDRLLEAAFSVSPSPTFRARIAARVAEEPLPGRGCHPLLWPAMAAATAFAIVLIVATGPPADQARRAPQLPIDGTASWTVSAPAQPVERRAPAERQAVDSLPPLRVVARFDGREQEAFAWLVTRAKAGDLAPSEGETEGGELEPVVSPLAVLPLEVVPIGFIDDSEGDPQP